MSDSNVTSNRPSTGGSPLRVAVVDAGSFTLPYDHSLCEALADRGLDVLLARSRFAAGPWDQASYRTWCEFFKYSNRWQVPSWLRGAQRVLKAAEHGAGMRRFVAAMADARPDVIHFQWLPLPLLDALSIGPLQRIAPLVLTLHDTTLFHGAPSSALQGLGLRRAVARFDRLVVHTDFSRQRAERTGLAQADRLALVPHGPLSYYRSRSAGATRDDGVLRILFFGSIKPYKGLDLLIEALAHLPVALRGRVRLVVAGQASMDLEPLHRLAASLGVAGLIDWRIEYIQEEDVAALFESASVVALTYREIDQSGVLLTAAAFGKAVVATRVGGIPEMLGDGERGLIADSSEPQSIALALARVLEDPTLRLSLGDALRRWCELHHSWPAAAAATESVYRELVARHRH